MKTIFRKSIFGVVVAMTGAPLWAMAQTIPDAGSLLEQTKPENTERTIQKKDNPPKLRLNEPANKPVDARIFVKSFVVEGNHLITSDEINQVLAAYINQQLSFEKLQEATRKISQLYRQHGWIARAFLPKQDITQGAITIKIVEAKYGGATIKSPANSSVRESIIKKTISKAQKEGELLDVKKLERALLLADDLPGILVEGSLVEGKKAGETDLIVISSNQSRVSGFVAGDNSGSVSTGAERALAGVMLYSPLGLGDSLGVTAMHTQGSDYLGFNYSVPVGYQGLRVGASISPFSYRLVAPEFKLLNAKGSADVVGVDLSYPVLRERNKNLYLIAAYDKRQLKNEANGMVQSNYYNNSATFAVRGNIVDYGLGYYANNRFSLGYTGGEINLGEVDFNESTAFSGRFEKIRYSLARDQSLSDNLTFSLSVNGQLAAKNLDTSERFYLGGINGVRAYPANEGVGSSGHLAFVEIKYRLPYNLTTNIFYDWGMVKNYNNLLPSYELAGWGVGLEWLPAKAVSLKTVAAQRIGTNPYSTAAGKDQDGSLREIRVWLTASLAF